MTLIYVTLPTQNVSSFTENLNPLNLDVNQTLKFLDSIYQINTIFEFKGFQHF